jgi:hypothetical protein
MNITTIPDELGLAGGWQTSTDGYQLTAAGLDVDAAARWMVAHQARFVTITARPAPDGECRIEYHWDLEGRLLTLVTQTRGGRIPSIGLVCPAADWVEREVHEYFAVEFQGRGELPPLMLRRDHPAGIFTPRGGQKP